MDAIRTIGGWIGTTGSLADKVPLKAAAFILVVAALLGGWLVLHSESKTITLAVVDESGRPVDHAQVHLFDFNSHLLAQAYTVNGRVEFKVPDVPLRYRVSKDGYSTEQGMVSQFDVHAVLRGNAAIGTPSPTPAVTASSSPVKSTVVPTLVVLPPAPSPTTLPTPSVSPKPTLPPQPPTPTPLPSATPTPTPSPTATPIPNNTKALAVTFNVKNGGDYHGRNVTAAGDGIQDDTEAIQNCLLAAGLHWRKGFLAAANATEPTRRVRVEIPAGDYFVQGRFLTAYPLHTEDIKYPPHYGVFIVPPGVALSGAGPDATRIILERGTRENRLAGQGTRIGTHVFLAGYEKGDVPPQSDMDAYCRQLPDSVRPLICLANGTRYGLKSFCGQLEGQMPAPMASDLCPWDYDAGGKVDLKAVSGSFITFENLAIHGDREALLGWYTADRKATQSFSSAIVVYRGNDFNATSIRVDDFYRTLYLRQTRGILVNGSEFHNGYKAMIFIETPTINTPVIRVAGTAVPFDARNRIEANRISTDLAFFNRMKKNEEAGVFTGYHVLMGVLILGNIDLRCEDTHIADNEFTLARIDLTTPCRKMVIERNRFDYNALPLRLGNQLDRWGMGFRRVADGEYQVEVKNNVVRHSLSGLAVAGCNDRGSGFGPRCSAITKNQVLIEGNRFEEFLPFSNNLSAFDPATDPAYWVQKMRSFGEDRFAAGIGAVDVSGIDIRNNTITGLKRGSQTSGIGILTTIHNIRNATHPWVHCYGPIEYNQNIQVVGNRIAFDADAPINPPVIPGESVGLYVENTLDVFVADNAVNAEGNRFINTRVSNPETTGLSFCQRTLFQVNASCQRRLMQAQHYMDAAKQASLSKKCAAKPMDPECLAYGYCLNQTRHNDESFILPWIRNPNLK